MTPKKRILILALSLAALSVTGPAAALAQNLCVTASRANLRVGPGKDFRISWEVNRHMPLIQMERQGEWIKVRDVDGEFHWISEEMVSAAEECVTVSAPRANIRMKPDAGAKRWFTVEKYTSFRKTGRQGRWVKIEHEQEVMWVFETLIWPG